MIAPKCYQRRRPEQAPWYRIVQSYLETWLDLASGEDGEAPPAHVVQSRLWLSIPRNIASA